MQGVLIDFVPFIAYEGGDEQQECALRLVKIGDDALCHFGLVGGQDDQTGGAAQQVCVLFLQVPPEGGEGFLHSDGSQVSIVVNFPLADGEWVGAHQVQLCAHDEQRLKGACDGGAHNHAFLVLAPEQVLDEGFGDDDFLLMHVMFADGFAGDGFEGAGTHMERHEVSVDALFSQTVKHFWSEVEAGGGGGHGAVVLGIDGLVALLVVGVGGAFDVGWERNFAVVLQPFGEGNGVVIPAEGHLEGAFNVFAFGGGHGHLFAVNGYDNLQRVFPSFGVAHHAFPYHLAGLDESGGGVVGGAQGFQTEYLDGRAGEVVHQQSRVYHFGVVEDEQAVVGQEVGQVVEAAVGDAAVAVHQELGVVALRCREEGDSFFGQVVIEVFYSNIAWFSHSGGKSKNKNRPMCPTKRKKVYFCSRKNGI